MCVRIALFFCMFFVECLLCVCEHRYINVGQQGEKHKKEKGETDRELIFRENI